MASSSTSFKSWKYDVFLSFRGEDTRKIFVDHLYDALERQTIRTYKDDVTLDRGDTIAPSLLKAIESSQILVIIFSENYADSSWCLDELSHIIKCRDNETGQIVMPIFHHVDPSYVRKQKGKYGEAFAKHELSENGSNKVEQWKKALLDASHIAGWEPNQVANGHEAKCIKEIVGSILDKLSSSDSAVEDENLVGMGTRLEELKSRLRIGSGGVHMVGIWGIGGGGKTTLATSLYKKFSLNFDGGCFLGNIREETERHGLQSLQEKILSTVFKEKMQVESVELGKDKIKQMLCRRKVLIVLDDVSHLDQLNALGCREWFGDGSRIIITTRDERVLTTMDEIEVSPISLLSHEEAVRLFNKYAYNKNKPVEDYKVISQQVVTYAAGLPLALVVLGSFLHDTNKDEWLSTLARLKDHPDMSIVEKLKISYDGLKNVEKELFLDIACFHRSESKDKAMEILDACGFYPAIGVKVLIQKALITVSKFGEIDMHDLVQEMAHYIIRGEHPNNPEKHSRLWLKKDIEDICSRSVTMENDKIEAINCDVSDCSSSSFIMLVSKMKKLRFLRRHSRSLNLLKGTTFMSWRTMEVDDIEAGIGCCLCSSSLTMFVSKMKGPSFLSNKLRYIHWYEYPASLFPKSFQPTQLVVLKLERSLQKELWKGYKYLPSLKELKLLGASKLERTPDFGGLPCLQKLTLEKCDRLKEIHQSLGNHNSLVNIRVEECKKLTRFPSIVRMDKLKILKVSGCRALVEFPKIEAKMDSLVKLSLENVGIKVLPSSLGEYCTNLISLKLRRCFNLKSIEGNFHALKCLENFMLKGCIHFNIQQLILPRGLRRLDLSWCEWKDGKIPKEVGELSSLQELHLWGNPFKRLDFSLSRLTSLKFLNVSYCDYLIELPELPSSLVVLRARGCTSLEAIVRDDIPLNCKCLCDVSIRGGRKNKIGGERLLETMLQGNAVETGRIISLQLQGMLILGGFEPHLVRGKRCRMELPENWYNDFSGFLFFSASTEFGSPYITMKHEKLDDVYLEKSDDYDDDEECSWVGYIPFGLLRNTLWWQHHTFSTAFQIEFQSSAPIIGCGCKLIPKRSETTATTSIAHSDSSSDNVCNDYNCKLHDLRDSMSTL